MSMKLRHGLLQSNCSPQVTKRWRFARICNQGHPHQRRLPGGHRNADGRSHAGEPTGCDEGDHEGPADWSAWSSGGDRRRGHLALQPWGELRHRSCACGRWRVHGALIEITGAATVTMRMLRPAVASVCLILAACAQAQRTTAPQRPDGFPAVPTLDDVRAVSPALARYTQGPLLGDLWKRPGLSPRDRSIVTLSALIARNQSVEMPYHFNLALETGVKPGEISEMLTHLAFYAGWPNVFSALPVVKDVFEKRPN